MKGPLGFSAEDLMQETLSMQRKLREGLKLLPGVDDVDYGVTEREEVWRDGKVVLYRFIGEQAPVAKTPLLIVYALVNRPYMVDLQADRSLVKGLLSHGQDVYVLDWGYRTAPSATLPWKIICCATSTARWIICARSRGCKRWMCSASVRAERSRCATPRCSATKCAT